MRTIDVNFECVEREIGCPGINSLRYPTCAPDPGAAWGPVIGISILTMLITVTVGLVQQNIRVPLIAAGIVAGIVAIVGWDHRRREATDPMRRSRTTLMRRRERIGQAVRSFRLHCGLYRQWQHEVALGLRLADAPRAERYSAYLERARHIIAGALTEYTNLCDATEAGFPLTAGTPGIATVHEPQLATRLRAIHADDAAVVQEPLDPTPALTYEELMEDMERELTAQGDRPVAPSPERTDEPETMPPAPQEAAREA